MASVKHFEVRTQMAAHDILCFEPNTLGITLSRYACSLESHMDMVIHSFQS